MKVVATNKKAYFDYFIDTSFEAGLALVGAEVKSIRAGNVSLKDSFVSFYKNEAYIKNMYIKKFDHDSLNEVDERRERKLLLSSTEISKISSKILEKGFTCVPLKLYFRGKFVKLEIALARGKHTYDKKAALKEKDLLKEAKREIKNF